MSTVRADLADALKPLLPTRWRIIPYADSLDRIDTRRPVLMLYRERITPTGAGTFHHIDNHMTLWLLTPRLNPGPADDALDKAADQLIAAVDALPWCTWDAAERGVWGDQAFAGYKLTLTATTEKENPQ